MAVTGAFRLKNSSIKIATVEYAQEFTKAQLNPSTDIQTLTTMVPSGVIQDVNDPVWTWDVTYINDETVTTGLMAILEAVGVGGTVAVIQANKNTSGAATKSFTIMVVAAAFGGGQGDFNTVDVSFPVIGQPTTGAVA